MRNTTVDDRHIGTGPRVVIGGAGFAGLEAARALRHTPVHVTVIDQTNQHVFQPLLYQRALVLFQWLWLYLTFQRGARLLTPALPTDLLVPPLVGASTLDSGLETVPEASCRSA